MGHEELVSKMRSRIDQCRRLAASTTDERTARVLREMADESELDLENLEAAEPITVILKPETPLS